MPDSTHVVIFLHLITGIWGASHALLNKRDSRSSLVWIILCLILPLIGPLGYYVFGINRLERIARKLNQTKLQIDDSCIQSDNVDRKSGLAEGVQHFVKITDAIEKRPLLFDNQITLLRHGEGAYPVMLEAIDHAQSLIVLSTYIFDNDHIGNQFAESLFKAKCRGVEVYVLVDGVGAMYSLPSIIHGLQKHDINCEKFLPFKLFPPKFSINLRNHRKILVVDQRLGFTGGINISDRHQATKGQQRKVSDMHFMLQGPVVGQLFDLFCKDWLMTTGEMPLSKQKIAFHSSPADKPCRVIADGPDEDLNKLSLILHGAICAAKQRVFIMTPYFIPSRPMIAIMLAAANRGVKVTVILPEKSNLPYVDAATRNLLWELLEWDIIVYYQPTPFEHGKLIVIDDCYVMIGSANIDPRSLRLNFELMVEILDKEFALKMVLEIQEIIKKSRQVTYQEVESRPLLTRIKDSLFWLFSPYL